MMVNNYHSMKDVIFKGFKSRWYQFYNCSQEMVSNLQYWQFALVHVLYSSAFFVNSENFCIWELSLFDFLTNDSVKFMVNLVTSQFCKCGKLVNLWLWLVSQSFQRAGQPLVPVIVSAFPFCLLFKQFHQQQDNFVFALCMTGEWLFLLGDSRSALLLSACSFVTFQRNLKELAI